MHEGGYCTYIRASRSHTLYSFISELPATCSGVSTSTNGGSTTGSPPTTTAIGLYSSNAARTCMRRLHEKKS
jgi:hypothetical protein